MTPITKRKRWILPSLVGSGLLIAAGTGGYHCLTEAPQASAVAPEPLSETETATLDAVVEVWSQEGPSESIEPADSAPTPPDPFVQPAMALDPLPRDASQATGDSSLLGPRYGEAPSVAPFDSLPKSGQSSLAPLAPFQTESDAVTRGQSPDPYITPVAPAAENPLRAGRDRSELRSPSPQEKETAFVKRSPPSAAALAAFSESPEQAVPRSDSQIVPASKSVPLPIQDVPVEPLPEFQSEGLPLAEGPVPGLPMTSAPKALDSSVPNEETTLPPTSDPLSYRAAPPEAFFSDNFSAKDSSPVAAPQSVPSPLPSEFLASETGLANSTRVEGEGRPGEGALEGRQQPSIAIQKFAPKEIQVGNPCKFLIKVQNVSHRIVSGVVVRDPIPAGARLTTTSPRAESLSGEVVWNLGDLSPGEERTMEMELTPIEEGEIGSVATVSFTAAASVKTKCTKPQLALRMTAPAKVLVGQEQRIQIELHNPGSGEATNVMILENVPDNLRHEAGPSLEFEVGSLRPGETRQLQLLMTAEKAGQVTNVLTAKADGNLFVDQKVEFEVVAPELAIDVKGPSKRYLERPATYTVDIGNPGTASAHDVRLVTHLPRAMRFVKANNMGEYDPTSHSVYWSLAELPEGENGSVEVVAIPVVAGDHTVHAEGETREGLKTQDSQQVRVEGIAAIKFDVLDLEDPIEVGGQTEYEVRVANQGTKAATNVEVRVTAPVGMRIVSATGEARHHREAQGVRFDPLPQLAPGTETLFRIRVEGAQPGDHRLAVEVGSDDLASPVRKEESTRVFGDE